MQKTKHPKQNAYYMLLAAAVMWGLSPIFYKKSLIFFSIVIFLSLRFLVGAISVFATSHKKFITIQRKVWIPLLIYVIVDGILLNYIYAQGLSHTSVLHVAIISISTPFFIYFFAAIILKEKVRQPVIIGGSISAAGLLIVLTTNSNQSGHTSLVGDLLILLNSALSALVIVYVRKMLHKNTNKLPAEQLTFIVYAVSSSILIVILVAGYLHNNIPIHFDMSGILWVLVSGIFCGALPLSLYYKAVKILPAQRLADLNYITPVIGVMSAVVFLGEQLNVRFVVGSVVLFVGLLISNNKLHPMIYTHYLLGLERETIEKMVRVERYAYQTVTEETESARQFIKNI